VGDVPVTRRAYKDICLRLSINYSDIHSSHLVAHVNLEVGTKECRYIAVS
jgi:hypothetical protein